MPLLNEEPITAQLSDYNRDTWSGKQSCLLDKLCSSIVFCSICGQQEDFEGKSIQREVRTIPTIFPERTLKGLGPWKICLIWRSFKERQALQPGRGASKQVQGEWLRLHHCEVVRFPWCSSLISSIYGEPRLTHIAARRRLPFFHYWYHCITRPALTWTKSA